MELELNIKPNNQSPEVLDGALQEIRAQKNLKDSLNLYKTNWVPKRHHVS